mgnify:CR=1 FL=1
MVEILRGWLLGLVAAALILTGLRALVPKGSIRPVARVTAGLVLLLVLILVAIVLFICVITGAPERAEEAAAPSGSRYQTAYIRAETPTVACYDADFQETGAVARGSEVTYLAEKTIQKNGRTYYLTYFDDLQYGYVDSEAFTDDPQSVVLEKTIYVRTPQNLRLSADGFELGGLVEQGTELGARLRLHFKRRCPPLPCHRRRIHQLYQRRIYRGHAGACHADL